MVAKEQQLGDELFMLSFSGFPARGKYQNPRTIN